GLVPVGAVVGAFGGEAVLDQPAVLADKEVDLPVDHVPESPASDHRSSSYRARCARALASHVSSARARLAPARASSSAAGSSRSSLIADAKPSRSPAATTRPAPNLRTGSAIPPTSYATAGTPAPSACNRDPLWSSSGRYGKSATVASPSARSTSRCGR